jgi:hypothetical protein
LRAVTKRALLIASIATLSACGRSRTPTSRSTPSKIDATAEIGDVEEQVFKPGIATAALGQDGEHIQAENLTIEDETAELEGRQPDQFANPQYQRSSRSAARSQASR